MSKETNKKPFKNKIYTNDMIDLEKKGRNSYPKRIKLVYRDYQDKKLRCPLWDLKELWNNRD